MLAGPDRYNDTFQQRLRMLRTLAARARCFAQNNWKRALLVIIAVGVGALFIFRDADRCTSVTVLVLLGLAALAHIARGSGSPNQKNHGLFGLEEIRSIWFGPLLLLN